MAQIGNLWAVSYDDPDRADQVRVEITKLHERHCLIMLDTAVAVRYADGSVTLEGEPFVIDTKIRSHTFARFLAGLVLAAPPLTGAAVGAMWRDTGTSASAAA